MGSFVLFDFVFWIRIAVFVKLILHEINTLLQLGLALAMLSIGTIRMNIMQLAMKVVATIGLNDEDFGRHHWRLLYHVLRH